MKLTNVTFTGNLAAGGTGGAGGNGGGTTAAEVGGEGGFGVGGQGGAIALFNGAAGQFASVTIAGNKAGVAVAGVGGAGSHGGVAGAAGGKGSTEGGNVFLTTATLSLRGTIIAGGEAEAGRENCVFGGGGVLTSLGHNLEDHHQCLTKPAAGDLVDTPAGLGPLAANGGPTETMALLPGSAAIDAGEPACVDAAGAPLSEDQRGDPRGTPCDIGAFEVQPEPPAEPGGPGEPSSPRRTRRGDSGGGAATPGGGGSDGSKRDHSGAGHPGQAQAVPEGGPRRQEVDDLLLAQRRGPGHLHLAARRRGRPRRQALRRPAARRPREALQAPGRGPRRAATRWAPPARSDRLAWTPKGLAAGAYVLTATPAGGKAATLKFNVRRPRKE